MLLLLLLSPVVVFANWTRVFQTTPAGARYGSRAAYCQLADSMVLVDDLCDGIFRFDFTTMQWSTIQLAEGSIKPSARSYFTFTKIAETPNACWHVMTSGKRIVPINVNHAWLLKIFPASNTAQWFVINITSSTRPEVRISSNAISLRENTVHLFGGSVQSTLSFNDLWEFTLNPEMQNLTYVGKWRQIPHSTTATAVWPLPRHAHAMAALDSNSFAVYGGRRYITPQEMNTLGVDLNYVFLDELAVFTVDTGVWRIVPASRIQRSSHAMFYSQKDHRMYSFGGYRRGKYSTFQSNDVLMSAKDLSSTMPCYESNLTTSGDKGEVWCNASDGDGQRPGPRFEFASIQRDNTFVVCGGLSLVNGEQSSLQDIWMYNMSSAVSLGFAFPKPDTSDADGKDSFYTGAMYYMIAVLILVLACGLVTVGVMKRRFRLHRQLQEQQYAQQQQQNTPPLPGQVGAIEEDIKRLPTRVYEKRIVGDVETAREENISEACAICLDDYQAGHELRDLPCMHSFHVECVDQWLGKHNVCPMCKRVVGGAASTESSSDGVPSPVPSPLPLQEQHGHSNRNAPDDDDATLANV